MYKKYIKRVLDIVVSLSLIVLLFPLILLTALITYIELGRPLFNHRKQKEGQYHKVFIMYKFRTSLPKAKVTDDKIYTKVTRVLDTTRLNELPQLFNILKGDMSFVGPRPFIPGDATLPKEKISEKRYLVKPGMTGLFQVTGGSHEDKLRCDEIYYDNLSFLLDFGIVLLTPYTLIKKIKSLKKHKI